MDLTQKTKDVVIIYPKLQQDTEDKPSLPLQALALSGPLLKAGFNPVIIDERVDEDMKESLRRLKSSPICFGISSMFSHQPKSGLNIAQWIKTHFSKVPIVWGGLFPTIMPMTAISDPRVDFVVKGKGETTFTELVQALYRNETFESIQGLVYKKSANFFETPDRPLEDPNQFPFKPYHLLDLEKYAISDGIVNFNSSYGCPFRCKFCCINKALNKKWNKGLTPERVLDEFEDIIQNFGINIKKVYFDEDNFFNNKERVRKILKLLVEKGLNIKWQGNMRIDQFLRFDPELLKLIKKSGCNALAAGAESANQNMLDFICKDLKVAQIGKAIEVAKEYDINLRLNFIVGLPQETEKGFKETLTRIKDYYRINPDLTINMYHYFPVPGTPLFKLECEQGLIKEPQNFEEWANIASESMVLSPFSDNKLTNYTNKKFKVMTFHFQLAYLIKDNHNKKITTIIKRLLRRISIFRFENNFWYFPIEWHLTKIIKKIKKA